MVLSGDGEQAYRITLRFPSGVVLDTALYWQVLDATERWSTRYSYDRFAREMGRPMSPIGAWNLAPVPLLPSGTTPVPEH